MQKFAESQAAAGGVSMCARHNACVNESVCLRETVMVLLFSTLVFSCSASASFVSCQGICVCASNIIDCSQRNLSLVPVLLPSYVAVLDLSFNSISRLRGDWTGVRLSALHRLLLSNNRLHLLSLEAFMQVRRLQYLDLSSNVLTQLDELVFEPLQHLEVLLLYNNRISHIDRSAFTGLFSLQKLYLSQNQMSRFPLELLRDRHRMEKLRLLDVSSNRIRTLPLAELQALPAWLKNGVYFHSNPLDCRCELYGMLIRWQQRELRPVADFTETHTCVQSGRGRVNTSILQLHLQLNCSLVHVRDEEAFINQLLVLDCDPRHRDVTKSWTLPRANQSAWVLPDGRLQIGPLQVEDSGEYTCLAAGEGLNESIVVMVRVHNSTRGLGEGFNTAYTTLGCCIFSLVLVILYLYFTPCPSHHGNLLIKNAHPDSAQSSTLSVACTHQQQGALASGRHVAFQEPKEVNCSLKCSEEENAKEENDEGQHDKCEKRTRRSSDSADSISSDTPIVV